jgi:hypothetical protein
VSVHQLELEQFINPEVCSWQPPGSLVNSSLAEPTVGLGKWS